MVSLTVYNGMHLPLIVLGDVGDWQRWRSPSSASPGLLHQENLATKLGSPCASSCAGEHIAAFDIRHGDGLSFDALQGCINAAAVTVVASNVAIEYLMI